MKLKCFFLSASFALGALFAQAEGKLKLKLGIETGYQLYVGEHLTPRSERQASTEEEPETFTNYNPCLPTNDEDYLHGFYAGVTGEILWNDERFGITTGLRGTQFVDVYDMKESQTMSTEEGDVELYSSSQLIQHIYYAGFPIEFRYLASRPGRPCRFYFKMGSSWNFLLAQSNIVKRTDPTTGEELKNRPDKVGREPDPFVGTLYPAIGCRFFRHYPLLNVELHLPAFVINMPTSYFAYNVGIGVGVSIQFPTDKKSYEKNVPLGPAYCK